MSESRPATLQRLIRSALGASCRIESFRSCSGGCIHRAEVVRLADGLELFVKSNRGSQDVFVQEAAGLAAIAQTQTIRTPTVIAVGPLEENEFCLVLEAISSNGQPKDFWTNFGQQLAELHRLGQSIQFGWSSHNYLGSTVQPNQPCSDWCQFWAEQRLGFQIQLAIDKGLATKELQRQVDRVIQRLDQLVGAPADPPSLLHGDLWSGNYIVSDSGEPVLIDPAVYYGRREAELAMCLLFGGFPETFYAGYHSAWPLADGWRQRTDVYQLYHLLNHLNLFGAGYLQSCLQTARKL